MRPIFEPRITKQNDKFVAQCVCGHTILFCNKHSALKMLNRGNCRHCMIDYRCQKGIDVRIYQRADGKWCSKCSGCSVEQAYTRKDHAKQSELSDWQCKKCVSAAKRFNENRPVGDETRIYNKFKKSAYNRGLEWSISQDEMFADFCGVCNLTGWAISTAYENQTASLDRINSSKGYIAKNIQWVHTMVNMTKNKYNEADFIAMCKAIAARCS